MVVEAYTFATNTFVVVTAFEAYTLPVTFSVVWPDAPERTSVAANTFVVVTAFETNTFPTTCRLLCGLVVPIPTFPPYTFNVLFT